MTTLTITISVIFWILMVLFLILGYLGWWPQSNVGRRTYVMGILVWLLLLCLGLRDFGLPWSR